MAQSLAMVNDCDTCLTSTLSTHEVTHSNVESTRARVTLSACPTACPTRPGSDSADLAPLSRSERLKQCGGSVFIFISFF